MKHSLYIFKFIYITGFSVRDLGGSDKVLVINFGGQYAHLISRRIRELNVYTEVIPFSRFRKDLINESVKAIVLSGGPASVRCFNHDLMSKFKDLMELGKPLLGICFGHQLIAKLIGGTVEEGIGEFGRTEIEIIKDDPLFKGWGRKEIVWMSHKDYVSELPSTAEVLAISERGYVAAFKIRESKVYGVQFHPEVKHTPKGMELLLNFVELAGIKRNWKPEDYVSSLVSEIKDTVGSQDKALVAVSGGIDSTVTALLAKKALGNRLIAVLVDHGLFREGEVEEVIRSLKRLGINPLVIDAKDRFLSKLWDVKDCELRRRIIGEEFARIFKEIANSDPSIKYFIQGTTYPDVIESGFEEGSDRIKSHHNVAALPNWLGLKVIEPLKHFYKDEVRKIGEVLGIPKEIIKRHPFPGPGLAVRVIGEFTPEKLEIVRRASKILEEELRRAGLYDEVWQAFAVVGDDKWVGVKGDSRVVGYVVTLRVVVSEDAMTADWARLPYELLDRVARRITSELSNVTMVTYAVTSKPPSTIEPC